MSAQCVWCNRPAGNNPSLWAAVGSIAPKIGCVPQTRLDRIEREQVDAGVRDGATTNETQGCGQLGTPLQEIFPFHGSIREHFARQVYGMDLNEIFRQINADSCNVAYGTSPSKVVSD